MFCQLDYSLDKIYYRDYFFQNISRAQHHKNEASELKFWFKMYGIGDLTKNIISDLNLQGLNIIPRFSYQLKNTRLPPHIDLDKIVGININLMDVAAVIHVQGMPYSYECALIDVGTKLHSVEPTGEDRLVLKLAIRAEWAEIYARLKCKNLLLTHADDYVSVLEEKDKKLVKK